MLLKEMPAVRVQSHRQSKIVASWRGTAGHLFHKDREFTVYSDFYWR